MDYEKKYKEALQRAESFYRNGRGSTKSMVYTIFPELAESEDEKIRKALIQNLKERFGTKGTMGEGLDMPNVLAWLEKQVEQNFAWSEEDEAMLENIKEILTKQGFHQIQANWLKSLKDRYTWKPSEEQLKGIECAIKTLQHQLNVGDKRLNSLYDDLKKLREE